MAKRVICLLDKEPEAKAIKEDMEEIKERTLEQAKFLEKKLWVLKEQYDKTINGEWQRLAQCMIDLGHLKAEDFDKKRDVIGIDIEGNCVWVEKNGHDKSDDGLPDGLPEELKNLLRGMLRR